jgi:hypothetical protein
MILVNGGWRVLTQVASQGVHEIFLSVKLDTGWKGVKPCVKIFFMTKCVHWRSTIDSIDQTMSHEIIMPMKVLINIVGGEEWECFLEIL